MPDHVPEHLVGPSQRARYRLRVWIQNNLVRVEAMAGGRVVRSVDAVTVELIWTCIRQKGVPDHVGLLRKWHAVGFFRRVRATEQTQFNLCRVRRKDREVDA